MEYVDLKQIPGTSTHEVMKATTHQAVLPSSYNVEATFRGLLATIGAQFLQGGVITWYQSRPQSPFNSSQPCFSSVRDDPNTQ